MARFGSSGGDGIVYATDRGRTCPRCEAALDACQCATSTPVQGKSNVRVGRETKGRKGKGATVITGLALPDSALEDMGRELKRTLGSGGTVREGVIEVQGDHRDAVVAFLTARGYRVRRVGG